MSCRYLTEDAKARELELWRRTQADLAGAGGPGIPDTDMMPWCETINALPGIVTLQSCEGHEGGEEGPSGHLWLWMDEERHRAFCERAFELAEHAAIERVGVIFQPWGQEIVEVRFQGSPTGALGQAMMGLVAFLRRTNRTVRSRLACEGCVYFDDTESMDGNRHFGWCGFELDWTPRDGSCPYGERRPDETSGQRRGAVRSG